MTVVDKHAVSEVRRVSGDVQVIDNHRARAFVMRNTHHPFAARKAVFLRSCSRRDGEAWQWPSISMARRRWGSARSSL